MHIELFAKDQALLYRMATELAMDGRLIVDTSMALDRVSLSYFSNLNRVCFYIETDNVYGRRINLTEKNYSETLNLILCKTL